MKPLSLGRGVVVRGALAPFAFLENPAVDRTETAPFLPPQAAVEGTWLEYLSTFDEREPRTSARPVAAHGSAPAQTPSTPALQYSSTDPRLTLHA